VSAEELAWSLEDLLGTGSDLSSRLPSYSDIAGFRGLTETQSVGDAWVSASLDVIDVAVSRVFDPLSVGQRVELEALGVPGEPWQIAERGGVWWMVRSEQTLRMEFDAEVAGPWWVELPVAAFFLHDIPVEAELVADPRYEVRVDGAWVGGESVTRRDFGGPDAAWPVTLTQGRHVLEVTTFPSADLGLMIDALEVLPDDALGATRDNPAASAWLGCDPSSDPCVRGALARLGRRAWRAEVSEGQLDAWMGIVALGEDRWDGVAGAVEAVLASPRFLFRVEAPGTEEGRALDGWERAARLSAALWRSVPDDALLDCAASGGLQSDDAGPCGASAQIERMMADPRMERAHAELAAAWLGTRTLFDPTQRGGDIDPELAASMAEGARRTVAAAVSRDAPLSELVLGETVMVDGALAAILGVAAPEPEGWGEVPAPEHRGGLLRHPAFLASTSEPTRTSPTRRGAKVLGQFFCEPPAPPPGTVQPLGAAEQSDVWDALVEHAANPGCRECHATIDPLGVTLESFDPLGVWRGVPEGMSALALPDGLVLDDDEALVQWVAGDPRYARCATVMLSALLLQRWPNEDDLAATERALGAPLGADVGAGEVVRAILASDAFLRRTVEGAP
jgi:hypothetical protein